MFAKIAFREAFKKLLALNRFRQKLKLSSFKYVKNYHFLHIIYALNFFSKNTYTLDN